MTQNQVPFVPLILYTHLPWIHHSGLRLWSASV